jgi:hypothetical protein
VQNLIPAITAFDSSIDELKHPEISIQLAFERKKKRRFRLNTLLLNQAMKKLRAEFYRGFLIILRGSELSRVLESRLVRHHVHRAENRTPVLSRWRINHRSVLFLYCWASVTEGLRLEGKTAKPFWKNPTNEITQRGPIAP